MAQAELLTPLHLTVGNLQCLKLR
uniref:Uncharacterized protein n=1 Tax=Moniliophthora roreri TaxID=221103 RepID=A0A0W0GBC6_MONRR